MLQKTLCCRRIGDVLPWDDDIDLAMDSADYMVLISELGRLVS